MSPIQRLLPHDVVDAEDGFVSAVLVKGCLGVLQRFLDMSPLFGGALLFERWRDGELKLPDLDELGFVHLLSATSGVVITGLIQHLETIFSIGEGSFQRGPSGPLLALVNQTGFDGVADSVGVAVPEVLMHRKRRRRLDRGALR